jgi:uncharacterized coiled-coil protein SlyX
MSNPRQICSQLSQDSFAVIEHRAENEGRTKAAIVSRLVDQAVKAGEIDIDQLKAELAVKDATIEQQREELGYLRLEFSKVNNALSQRLLAEAKPKGFWARLRGR